MTQVAPAFWVRYRGTVDPQQPFNTTYNYGITMLAPGPIVLFSGTRTVIGPPQLTKENFMEVNWTIPPGLVRVLINRQGNASFQSNGSAGGYRDEGQYLVNNGGVLNQ